MCRDSERPRRGTATATEAQRTQRCGGCRSEAHNLGSRVRLSALLLGPMVYAARSCGRAREVPAPPCRVRPTDRARHPEHCSNAAGSGDNCERSSIGRAPVRQTGGSGIVAPRSLRSSGVTLSGRADLLLASLRPASRRRCAPDEPLRTFSREGHGIGRSSRPGRSTAGPCPPTLLLDRGRSNAARPQGPAARGW